MRRILALADEMKYETSTPREPTESTPQGDQLEPQQVQPEPENQQTKFMWTQAKGKQLSQLLGDGKSLKETANILGTTRNAVKGKAEREGIPSKDMPGRQPSKVPEL